MYNTKQSVSDFLKNHSVGVLSTVSPDGKPYASPIYFIADDDLNFYFTTKSDTKKSQNFTTNKHVALTVVDHTIPLTIQSTGTVKEVEEPDMYAKLAEANAKAGGEFSWPPPLSKLESAGYLLLYKYTPEWLRVGDFSEPQTTSGVQKNVFHEIIPGLEEKV